MPFALWLRRCFSKSNAGCDGGRRPRRRLSFDPLENRLVPSTSAVILAPPGPFSEGSAINLTSMVVDQVGVTPSFAWTVTKNGSSFASGTTTDGKFSFTPDDNASYVVSMSVTDDANTTAAPDVPLTADNVVPTAAISGPTTETFQQQLTFTLSATDPSTADAAAGFTYNIDWNNDGIPDETVAATANNGGGNVTVTHIFTTPGDNTFSVTATDKDGGVSAPATHTVSLTNTVTVYQRALTIAGTNGPDAIIIVPKGPPTTWHATVRVFMNGQDRGTFGGVNSIVVYALDGNDFVFVAGSIRVSATVFGGAGDDFIKGGQGRDILVGGDGNDWLNGGQGNDILIGGNGSDRLIGGPNDSLLIAGATSYDADLTSLQALQTAWLTQNILAVRVAAVINPGATVHLASGIGGTLLDDGATDRLTGAAGNDAFFAVVGSDIITDLHPFEFLNGVMTTTHRRGH